MQTQLTPEPSLEPSIERALEPSPAIDPLDGRVYDELKRIARHHLRVRAAHATISTTDLVHEAYLKFGAMEDAEGAVPDDAVPDERAPDEGSPWRSRAHFFGSASRAMRQVLVDYARNRLAAKRGGGLTPVTLTGRDADLSAPLDDLVILDDALERLRKLDERLCRVVELRFFAGLTDAEIAEALGVTVRTVGRDWVKARLYLSRALRHA